MTIRTALLVSDDPDDPVEFSEALYQISDDTVLVTVSDVNKAIDLLRLKHCVPDFVFVNTAIEGFAPDRFFDTLEHDPGLRGVKVLVFGDPVSYDSDRIMARLYGHLSFSRLKKALSDMIR